MRVDAGRDDPAEELAAHAEAPAAGEHRAGGLALEGRRVDAAFARHDQRRRRRARVEARQVEHELGPRDELGAERREPCAEPAAGARTGQVPVRAPARSSPRAAARARRPPPGPLPSAARTPAPRPRRPSSGLVTSQATRIGTPSSRRPTRSRIPAPPSTVAVPPTPTSSDDAPAARTASSRSPSPCVVARSGSRSARGTSGSPTACAESTTAVPSGSTSQRRLDRRAQRPLDDDAAPLAAERGREHGGGSLAPVGHRRLDRRRPRRRGASPPRGTPPPRAA